MVNRIFHFNDRNVFLLIDHVDFNVFKGQFFNDDEDTLSVEPWFRERLMLPRFRSNSSLKIVSLILRNFWRYSTKMNNNAEIDDLHCLNVSSSSLRDSRGSIGSFYIPGITEKARCLSSTDTLLQHDDMSLYNSRSDGLSLGDDSISSSRRRTAKKDARFSKMMQELSASRKKADEARAAVLLVKERFLNESSTSTRFSLDDDPIFDELRRFCNRAAWAMRTIACWILSPMLYMNVGAQSHVTSVCTNKTNKHAICVNKSM